MPQCSNCMHCAKCKTLYYNYLETVNHIRLKVKWDRLFMYFFNKRWMTDWAPALLSLMFLRPVSGVTRGSLPENPQWCAAPASASSNISFLCTAIYQLFFKPSSRTFTDGDWIRPSPTIPGKSGQHCAAIAHVQRYCQSIIAGPQDEILLMDASCIMTAEWQK